jgi:hypothetical protein
LIYRRTTNLRSVQFLSGHSKLEVSDQLSHVDDWQLGRS